VRTLPRLGKKLMKRAIVSPRQYGGHPIATSLSIAVAPKMSKSTRLIKRFNKMLHQDLDIGESFIPNAYISRGWDATNKGWREAMFPNLDEELRPADREGTTTAWHVCKVRG
jgi:hypothetical protein